MSANPSAIPGEAPGIFDVGSACTRADITRGSGNVFLIGEGAGNTPLFIASKSYKEKVAAVAPGSPPEYPICIDQGWGQGFVQSDRMLAITHYCYGSVLGVTAQCGGFPGYGPFDEPLNGVLDPQASWHRLVTAAVDYNQGNDNGPTVALFDTVSGFRSSHPGGARFGFADGSVRFIQETIDPKTYRALSTRAAEIQRQE